MDNENRDDTMGGMGNLTGWVPPLPPTNKGLKVKTKPRKPYEIIREELVSNGLYEKTHPWGCATSNENAKTKKLEFDKCTAAQIVQAHCEDKGIKQIMALDLAAVSRAYETAMNGILDEHGNLIGRNQRRRRALAAPMTALESPASEVPDSNPVTDNG